MAERRSSRREPGRGAGSGSGPGSAAAGAGGSEELARLPQAGGGLPLGQQTSVSARPENLRAWNLPTDPNTPGEYIVELNLQHRGALEGATERFLAIYKGVVKGSKRRPVPISRSYYSCLISLSEQEKLVRADKKDGPRGRSIYRIWPDFEVKAFIDRSVATVKADAARRAFAATGRRITWAVIDSGINGRHPHFKLYKNLHAEDVVELHRDFTLREPSKDGALEDEYGHGTHVAGIIAGGLPEARPAERGEEPADGAGADAPLAFEKVIESESDARASESKFERREVDEPSLLSGVAPACQLVSLKVLDRNGNGRASNVMRALQYVRERVNADPKMLRIHGVNISAGYEFSAEVFACGQSPLCVEVNRLVRAGVVVVVASGNTGYGAKVADQRPGARGSLTDTINDPGNADLAITVGSTHRYMPHTYGVSFFSSKGPTGDGRLKPDLVAPGERITSCAAGSWLEEVRVRLRVQAEQDAQEAEDARAAPVAVAAGGARAAGPATEARPGLERATDQADLRSLPVPAEIPDDAAAYVDRSGTSMAAPHVSGAIAAFLSIRREFIQKPEDVKRVFLQSATPLGREKYFEGHGLVDLMRAIQSV